MTTDPDPVFEDGNETPFVAYDVGSTPEVAENAAKLEEGMA